MDHVTSLLVLYAEVKTKKPKPLTIQQVAQEEGKGSLQEIKQGRESGSEKTKASTELGLWHKVSVCPSVKHPDKLLPTLELTGLDLKSSFKRLSKCL